ncbi:MAG: glycosyltransferase [Clostridia bacterium]|nr:glycosyltransferase [Clostridia bacterium]
MKVIHVISGGDSGGAKTHLIALAKELVKHIDLKIVCFLEGDFYIEAKKIGLPVVLIKQNKRTDALFSKELIKFIEKEQPDIVHAHGARANFTICLNRKKIKCPIITTVHSDYRLDFKDNLYKYIVFTCLNKISLGAFDFYIGVSPEFKKMLVDRGYKEDRVYSIFNGVDFNEHKEKLSKEDFAKKYNLDLLKLEGKTIIGNLSRLDAVKAVDVFVDAAAEALKENKDIHFLVAGDGNQREALEKQIERLGIGEDLTLMGFITDPTSFLDLIDVNCITSHCESFTYSLLEGAREHKASIASRVGGLPYLIKDKETGLLFEDNDINGLKDAMLKYVSDENFRSEMGENLYKFASENFSTEAMCKKHLEIYDEVIKRGKQK